MFPEIDIHGKELPAISIILNQKRFKFNKKFNNEIAIELYGKAIQGIYNEY